MIVLRVMEYQILRFFFKNVLHIQKHSLKKR